MPALPADLPATFPDEATRALAADAAPAWATAAEAARAGDTRSVELRLRRAGARELRSTVPAEALALLADGLAALASGATVHAEATRPELSAAEAARLLGVPAWTVSRWVHEGALPAREVRGARVVAAGAVAELEARIRAARTSTLDELALEGERLALGY